MIYNSLQNTLSLLASVKYSYDKTVEFDYQNKPRPCHNFVFMLEGKGIITTNDKTITIEKRDILYIPKNTTYSAVWQTTTSVSFHSLHFNFQSRLDPLLSQNIPIQKLNEVDFDTLYPLMQEIKNTQSQKNSNNFLILSAFYKICGEVFPKVHFNEQIKNNPVLPAINYIENHFNQALTIEQLANLCFLSPSRFFYLFKKHKGVSPIVYKNKVALQNTMQELLFDKESPIEEIARRNGFKSVIYFERQFKKATGKTPSQYRKEEILL